MAKNTRNSVWEMTQRTIQNSWSENGDEVQDQMCTFKQSYKENKQKVKYGCCQTQKLGFGEGCLGNGCDNKQEVGVGSQKVRTQSGIKELVNREKTIAYDQVSACVTTKATVPF